MPSIDVAETIKDLGSYTSSTVNNAETRFRRYVAEVEIQEADLATYREIAQGQARELVYLRTELESLRNKPHKAVDISFASVADIVAALDNLLDEKFSVRVEEATEPTVKEPKFGYETPEAFQDFYIGRDYTDTDYSAWCDVCGWGTDGTEPVVDAAAYEHAEKHVNEEKENK